MDATVFWTTVKPLMKEKQMTQETLAELCEVPFGTLHGWIAKKILPDVASAYRIAVTLGTSVEFLVTGGASDDPYRAKYESLVRQLKTLIE